MFTDPIKNLKALGLREDAIIADLGAGTGYYSIVSAKLAPHGKVYAVEIVKDFLKTIQNKVKDSHLKNVECIVGNIEKIGGSSLAESIVDVVIASNVLFQVEHKDNFIQEIKRILKPGGRVLLVDWSDTSIMRTKLAIVPKEKALGMFEAQGFVLERNIDAGEHHYGMILTKE